MGEPTCSLADAQPSPYAGRTNSNESLYPHPLHGQHSGAMLSMNVARGQTFYACTLQRPHKPPRFAVATRRASSSVQGFSYLKRPLDVLSNSRDPSPDCGVSPVRMLSPTGVPILCNQNSLRIFQDAPLDRYP